MPGITLGTTRDRVAEAEQLRELLARHAQKAPQLGAPPNRLMNMGQAEALGAGFMASARNGQWGGNHAGLYAPRDPNQLMPDPPPPMQPQLGARGAWGRGATGAWGPGPPQAQEMPNWTGAAMMGSAGGDVAGASQSDLLNNQIRMLQETASSLGREAAGGAGRTQGGMANPKAMIDALEAKLAAIRAARGG